MLTTITYRIISVINRGFFIVNTYVNPIIYILIGLEIALFSIMMVLGKHQNLGSIVLKILSIGVMLFIITWR